MRRRVVRLNERSDGAENGPWAPRMSQRVPLLMTVMVWSSPGTANGSTHLMFALMLAVAGPVGVVLK